MCVVPVNIYFLLVLCNAMSHSLGWCLECRNSHNTSAERLSTQPSDSDSDQHKLLQRKLLETPHRAIVD